MDIFLRADIGALQLGAGGATTVTLDTNGRVGIGISTPATTAKLHVEQGASPGAEEIARFTVSDDSTGLLRIVNTTTSDGLFNPGIETLQAGTGVGRLDLVRLTTDSGTTPGLIIDVRSAAGTAITTRPLVDYRSSGASRMIILGNGNIGIATTSPQALLHVGAGTDAPDTSNVNIYATNAGTTAIAARNSTGNIEVFMLAGTSSALIGTITNHPLFLRTNNTNHVFLQVDGTMGIRTSSPSATLSIKAGESTDHANVGGIIHVNTTAAGNVGSGEQDLMTFSVPANTLAVNGDSIWFEISAHIASSLSTSKIIRIRFGNSGTNLVHTTNDINSTTTGHVVIRGRIVRTGSSSQISYANNNARANAVNPYFTTIETGLNQTLSSTVTFRVTGQATNNDDIIIQSLVIGWDPVNT
ncbi:MAG: hypothetical protein UZ13_01517 [Chloroflexi bacterium OLB13]|nr:MAG: hypothetical protein UZ13_01517 [Chloroflexi bacterium OLB13]